MSIRLAARSVAGVIALLVCLQVLLQVRRGPGGGVRVGWPALQPLRLPSPPASW